MYYPPDYSLPEYDLSPQVLGMVRALQAMPPWKRRQHYRQWEARVEPLIYKYLDFSIGSSLSMKKVRDLLVESELYLAAPSDFNDPYDFTAHITHESDAVRRRQHFVRVARKVVKSNPSVLPHIHGRANKIQALVKNAVENAIANPTGISTTFEVARDHNGISCFSQDGRNLLMWSHYGAGHTGVCLQFDATRDPGVLMVVHKVDYQEAPAHLEWPRDRMQIVADVILRKGKIWELEKEVRYVSLTAVRNSIAFDGRAVTGLILGARFPRSALGELTKMLEEREKKGLPAPKIFRAERRPDRYGVFLKRLPGLPR